MHSCEVILMEELGSIDTESRGAEGATAPP